MVYVTYFIILFVAEEKTNLGLIHDPEKILYSSSLDHGNEVDTELVTEATFVAGSCANKFHKDSKPRIFYLTNQSITNRNGIPSVAAALKQCLENHDVDDTVILCSSLLDVDRAKGALKVLGRPSEEYIPYIKGEIPSEKKKKELLDKISGGSTLLSDYRSYRGCEASYSIIFIDKNRPIAGTIMAEMLSRAMVDLDIIVLPNDDAITSIPNPIQMAFDTWLQRDLIEPTTVEFHDEDESTATFNLQKPTQTKSVKIDIIGCDFDLSYSNANKESEIQYK